MNVIQYSDYNETIRYALSSRPQRGAEVEIVLDLFRGSSPMSQTTLARVDRKDAPSVLLRCRRDLEGRGLHAVARAPVPTPELSFEQMDPRQSLPVAAFDWMFEAG